MGTQMSSDEITGEERAIAGLSSDLQDHTETIDELERASVILRVRISQKDAAIVERDQKIEQLQRMTEDLEKELLVSKKAIEKLRRSNKRQNRRINFLTEKDAELQGHVDELNEELNERLFSDTEGDIQYKAKPAGSHRQEQARDSLGGLESRVADLSLTNNDLGRLIKDERRKVLDLRNEVSRRDRMIEFLNLRITSYVVDGSDDEHSDGS